LSFIFFFRYHFLPGLSLQYHSPSMICVPMICCFLHLRLDYTINIITIWLSPPLHYQLYGSRDYRIISISIFLTLRPMSVTTEIDVYKTLVKWLDNWLDQSQQTLSVKDL
jgi:hypothetical protein